MINQENGHCLDMLIKISDYLDGELDAKLYSELEKHLSVCNDCREVLATLKKTLDLCKTAVPTRLSPEVIERLKINLYEKCAEEAESKKILGRNNGSESCLETENEF